MKSEHRHDLQTNELGKYTEKAAVWIDVHGNRLMVGICLACLPLAGFIYWWRSNNNAQAAAWRDFSAAVNVNKAEDFHSVWQDHPGTVPAYWARVHEGERWLAEGIREMFSNVELGTTHLKKAQDAFQAVLDASKAPVELRDRALIGLGRTLESMSNGSENEAVNAYKSLVDKYPDSIYKKDAEERIAVLTAGDGQEFYAWFSKYARPKLPVKGPRDKSAGDDQEDISEEGINRLNSALKLDKKTDDKATDDESMELSDTEKPTAEDKPAKKPADATPEKKAKSDSEPQPDSVPEPESKASEPDNDKKE